MSILYADTSALARAHLPDEAGHGELYKRLRSQDAAVLTSVLTRVEFARAARAAGRTGRLKRWRVTLERFEHDCRPGGPITVLALDPGRVLPAARELVLEHPIGTLDAIHLTVALQDGREVAGEDLVFVTRDRGQARAARKLGLAVA